MTTGRSPPRVPLAFRVGASGSRVLAAGVQSGLQQQMRAVLGDIARMLRVLAGEARGVYAADGQGAIMPRLRVVSPLAEGADRLVAEAALSLGYALEAPLPFAQADYEADFSATIAGFRALLARATRRLELDGDRDDRERGYEAVGRHVVRNADLLIAVWDGRAAKGRGGTGDIVRFAIRTGVPVWWLHSDGSEPPRLLRTQHELRDPSQAPAGEKATQALGDLLRGAVVPPRPAVPHAHTAIGQVVQAGCRLLRHETTPLHDYLREDAHRPAKIWRAYTCFMDRIAPDPAARVPGGGATELVPEGTIETYWYGLHAPADTLSQDYGDRYRSSYILVFGLAFLAVICAVLALAFAAVALPATLLELLILAAIGGLVTGNHALRWHERWISYRLLSELCRKQRVLGPIGWSLPNWEVERLTAEGAPDPHEAVPDAALARDAWVAWYFTACRRAAPRKRVHRRLAPSCPRGRLQPDGGAESLPS